MFTSLIFKFNKDPENALIHQETGELLCDTILNLGYDHEMQN